jgi:predicted ATPase
MEIKQITIKNFKGIECVELGPIKPINILIGRNNAGKSSIASALNYVVSYLAAVEKGRNTLEGVKLPVLSSGSLRYGQSEFKVKISVGHTPYEVRENLSKVLQSWNKLFNSPRLSDEYFEEAAFRDKIFETVSYEYESRGSIFGLRRVCIAYKGKEEDIGECAIGAGNLACLQVYHLFLSGRNINNRPDFNALRNGSQYSERIPLNTHGVHEGGTAIFLDTMLRPSLEFIKTKFASAFIVDAYRHATPIQTAQMCERLLGDGNCLVTYLHNLALNDYKAFTGISAFAKRILPELGRLHARFAGQNGSNIELAYEWESDQNVHSVNLANMGGGVEQLLILGCLLISQKPAIIFSEEPESHLHPAAQEALLSEIKKKIGETTIFITTHSPVFIRPDNDIAVHAIENPDGKHARARTLNENDLCEAAFLIGSRPGHLAQADIVVYVEGKWGVPVIEEWLKKWPKYNKAGHLRILIQHFNPDEACGEEVDLGKLIKITPHMLMFVDRDNEPGEEMKRSRQILSEKCQKLGIPMFLTDGRQIESYFDVSTVRACLSTQLQEQWDKDHKFSNAGKKFNREIARKMEWNELENKPNLMELFAQIEKFIDRLKQT